MKTFINIEEGEIEIRADDAGEITQLANLATNLKKARLVVCGVPVGVVAMDYGLALLVSEVSQ
jgi:hypothetical protein